MNRKLVIVAIFIALFFGLTGCEKQIEQIKANAVTDVLVSSKWEVQQYLSGTDDLSSEFEGYEFQFFRDQTVISIKEGTSISGTWNGNASTSAINANFPIDTALPLIRLNGTWVVSSYSSNGPRFNQTINGVEAKLVLKKK